MAPCPFFLALWALVFCPCAFASLVLGQFRHRALVETTSQFVRMLLEKSFEAAFVSSKSTVVLGSNHKECHLKTLHDACGTDNMLQPILCPFPFSVYLKVEWCESPDGMLSVQALRPYVFFTSWANCSAADRAGGTLAMSGGNRQGKNMKHPTGAGDCTWGGVRGKYADACSRSMFMIWVSQSFWVSHISFRKSAYSIPSWHESSSGPLFSLHCALISLGFASATLIADGKWLQRLVLWTMLTPRPLPESHRVSIK